MRRGTVLLVCGLVGCCWGGLAWADQGTDTQRASGARIAELIEQLGAKSYVARRRAARELIAVGAPAKDGLLAARGHRDPEVRYRVGELLQTVLELDFHLRLKAFIADVDGRTEHHLAGWSRYRELVGENGPARRLFATMQQAERHLLEVAEFSPADAGELLEERCEELQAAHHADEQPSQAPSLGSIAAVLFVASDPELPVSPQAGTCVYNLSVQGEMHSAATTGEKAQTVKRLLGAWVRRSEWVDWTVANQSCILAVYYRLQEGIDLARSLLQGDGTPQLSRQYSIQTLARLGGKQLLPEIGALLADRSEVAELSAGDQDETIKTLICDVALASLIYLTGQNLGDYGFDVDEVQSNSVMLFDARTLGFADADAREAALIKWKDWAETHIADIEP
ncbi:MAG TPA: hypothetical protein VND64_09725 [Pirellulales bacterium]|nr:hypothetical protein [Pirellulales bacterium]